MKDIIEFEHKGVTLSASRAILVQALAEHVGLATTSAPLSGIPRINERWSGQGGFYMGICGGENGEPDYHLILADDDGEFKDVNWSTALEKCEQYSADGHTDFSAPTRREQALCFANGKARFQQTYYWSKEQYSAYGAWCQHFHYINQDWYIKGSSTRVRAVRRIFIK